MAGRVFEIGELVEILNVDLSYRSYRVGGKDRVLRPGSKVSIVSRQPDNDDEEDGLAYGFLFPDVPDQEMTLNQIMIDPEW